MLLKVNPMIQSNVSTVAYIGTISKNQLKTKPYWETSRPKYELFTPSKRGNPNIMNYGNEKVEFGTKSISIPFALNRLKGVVDKSRHILELEDNWDDEESESYSENVWENALTFVVNLHLTAFKVFTVKLDYPKIYPGPNGSIDIAWKADTYEVLVNFPVNPSDEITYYGEDIRSSTFKGSFKSSTSCNSLLMILIGMKKCGK